MPDFTSALYLSLKHRGERMRPWVQLTAGKPATLEEPYEFTAVANQLAALMGCEAAVIAPSTLHLFWDLFGLFDAGSIALYVDESCYPIARWGGERAWSKGAPLRCFSSQNATVLRQWLGRDALFGRTPVVLTDGYSPAMGRPAPVAAYLEAVSDFGGYLIIDDTQALGILGSNPGPTAPYGFGGGGILRWAGIRSPCMITIASLAKGFGAPAAVMAGSMDLIEMFKNHSATRVHCSQPSFASIHSTAHALNVNRTSGERLRRCLARNVHRFRSNMSRVGLSTHGGGFPIQTLSFRKRWRAAVLYRKLLHRGIHTVPQCSGKKNDMRISFIITAGHGLDELDMTALSIANVLGKIATNGR